MCRSYLETANQADAYLRPSPRGQRCPGRAQEVKISSRGSEVEPLCFVVSVRGVEQIGCRSGCLHSKSV